MYVPFFHRKTWSCWKTPFTLSRNPVCLMGHIAYVVRNIFSFWNSGVSPEYILNFKRAGCWILNIQQTMCTVYDKDILVLLQASPQMTSSSTGKPIGLGFRAVALNPSTFLAVSWWLARRDKMINFAPDLATIYQCVGATQHKPPKMLAKQTRMKYINIIYTII